MAAYIAALPGWVKLLVPATALVLLAGGLAFLLTQPKPQATRPPQVAPTPSPSELLTPSPSPEPSPSPSPEPSPSPSPSPQPSVVPSHSNPPPPACGTAPAGGFPGSQLAANYPTALAWSTDGRLFWTERTGTIRVWQGGAAQVFAQVPTTTSGERGLLGLAIAGKSVFAFYSNTDGTHQEIDRWTDCGGVATAHAAIVTGLPAGTDCCHKGGRLAVSPDGHLFATIGDTHNAPQAQNTGSLLGKVIRYNQDGTGQQVWVAGLRNPFGIAFAPDGSLALTNNGPSGDAGTPCGSCGDEFYLVGRSGGIDYQWPYCWGYSHPFGGSTGCHGLPEPQFSTEGGPYQKSNPYFVAPTGMTWTGANFVFCASSNSHMYRYDGLHSVADLGAMGCALDVKLGPDGHLYTSDGGAIYRH